jgi:predicted solute-binding protein
MVFAVWAGRPEVAARLRGIDFEGSLGFGLTRMEDYLAEEAERRGLDAGTARDYLLRHIAFEIGRDERRGMEQYLTLAAGVESAQLTTAEALA